MLCVAQNHRLQAHRHCCLTWIFCVKWNMRDQSSNRERERMRVRSKKEKATYEDPSLQMIDVG